MRSKFKMIVLFFVLILGRILVYIISRSESASSYNCLGGFMGFGMIGMALFWIVILVVGLSFVPKEKPSEKSELNILKERLADGKVTLEEYEMIKQRLERDKG